MQRTAAALIIGLTATLFAGAAGAESADIRGDITARLGTLERKFIGLAEAMPQEKYTWRPGEGVRSVSEVFLHVTSANYRFPQVIGASIPAGIETKGLEQSTTDITKIIEQVKKSFANVRAAVENVPASDIDKPVKLFGRDNTYRGALVAITEHLSEHLGQSIAYARVNGVVPPWSR